MSTTMTTTDPTVHAAAMKVAEMESRTAKTRAALEAAEAAQTKLRTRISDLDAEQAAIVSRRAGGERRDDDGARLALIAADIAGLVELEAEAAGAAAKARTNHEAAETMVARAGENLTLAESGAAVSLLAAHAADLDSKLTATLAELRRHAERIGRPTAWRPSAAFYAEVRKAALQAGLV